MDEIDSYVLRVADFFKSRLGRPLVEVYKLGSLAHGGFSAVYSDIDVGVLLDCSEPPAGMAEAIDEAKDLDPRYGKKLSVFWGNPDCAWGRLPVIDRLDLLDHALPLLRGHKPQFRRPAEAEIHQALRESFERSYRPRVPEFDSLRRLEPHQRKPYIRAVLYPARLIYTWDNLAVDSNDRAVEYLRRVCPPNLDLKPIDLALACRQGKSTADEVFALAPNLNRQFEAAFSYISENSQEPGKR
jgi:predicted nucleotidyltransferase